MEEIARKLRQRSTDAELKLWHFLRNRQFVGHKFRRQHPLPPYIVDFVCLEEKLIVELDGGQHLEQKAHDDKRTAFLQSMGFRVIRFWNDDVLLRTDSVLEEILRMMTTPPLQGAHSAKRNAVRRARSMLREFPDSPLTLSPQAGRGNKTCSPRYLAQTKYDPTR